MCSREDSRPSEVKDKGTRSRRRRDDLDTITTTDSISCREEEEGEQISPRGPHHICTKAEAPDSHRSICTDLGLSPGGERVNEISETKVAATYTAMTTTLVTLAVSSQTGEPPPAE